MPDTHLTHTDFLPAPEHQTILDWALACEKDFRPSTVGTGEASPMRQSLSLADFGPCRDIMRDALKPMVTDLGRYFGVALGAKQTFDASFVAHTDGAYYRPHTDVGAVAGHRSRALSAVYYFCRSPQRFEGGELRIFRLGKPGEFVDVPARDNQLVVFPAMVPHEVRPVRVPSQDFADARFAINVWVHRHAG